MERRPRNNHYDYKAIYLSVSLSDVTFDSRCECIIQERKKCISIETTIDSHTQHDQEQIVFFFSFISAADF